MDAKIAEIFLETANYVDVRVDEYQGYSGRGMFGKQTTGVTFSPSDEQLVFAAAGAIAAERDMSEEFLLAVKQLRQDNIGRDMIIY